MINTKIVLFLCLLAITPIVSAQERSQIAKNQFKHLNPCPATGATSGPCPGFIIDHITPLACGGADYPTNMQWQSTAAARAKDKWERQGCSSNNRRLSPRTSYYRGKRGGCYTYTANGSKRYVNHALCGVWF